MKKIYKKPIACEETFMSNEYVAACWGVACSIDPANKYEKNHNNTWIAGEGSDKPHGIDHCGQSANQHITTNSNNVAISMIEDGTDRLGKLNCTLYTDESYSKTRKYSDVKIGDYIYWTTSASGSRTWHHQGRVTGTYPNKPNHS